MKNNNYIKIFGLLATVCFVLVVFRGAGALVPKGERWAPPKEWKGSPAPWNSPKGFGRPAAPWAPPKGIKPVKDAWKPPKGFGQPAKPWEGPRGENVEPGSGTGAPAAPYQGPVKTPDKNLVPIDKDRLTYPNKDGTVTP